MNRYNVPEYSGNVVIIGQHTGNIGDEIAGCSLLQKLLASKSVGSIVVVYRGWDNKTLEINHEKITHETEVPLSKIDVINIIVSNFFKRNKPNLSLSSEGLKRLNKLFDNSDTILVSPSGANIGIYRDERLLAMLLLAEAKGKTPIFHYCTIGKSGSIVFDWVAKSALKRAKLFLREKKSVQYAESLGIKNSSFGFDTAFGFKRFKLPSKEIQSLVEDKAIIMIITQLHTWHPDFIDTTVDDDIILKVIFPSVAELAKRESKKIVLLPHILEKSELDFLHKIVQQLPENIGKLTRIADIHSVNDYDFIIESACLIVTMRYHGIVMAAKNARPFLAIAYENKMHEVSDYIGCAENCIPISGLYEDEKVFKQNLNRIWENSGTIVQKMKDFNPI